LLLKSGKRVIQELSGGTADRALEFDVNNIAKEWTALLNDIHD
jgi:hypothetical protein